MRHIKIDYRRPAQRPPRPPRQRPPQQRKRNQNPRCAQHSGVHMVLAGSNPQWNTIRYMCPMCSAMGLPPVEIANGVVSGYWPQRGYGFVDNGGPRIFFHASDMAGRSTPYVGMPVTCRVEQNDQGLIGRQVCPR